VVAVSVKKEHGIAAQRADECYFARRAGIAHPVGVAAEVAQQD